MTYNYLTNCLACGGRELQQYLDLGHQTFPNLYPEKYGLAPLPACPLQVNLCLDCYHSQLSVVANPKELFSDYLYVSGTTQSLKDHFRSLVTSTLPMKPADKISVLDIGANDYSLLKEFQRRGVKVEGVDPAANLASQAGNIPALVDFWGREAALKVTQAPYDLITGLNVFAHNSDPLGFLEACKLVLKDTGHIVLEFPWFKETVQRRAVGQIYAEHISYFTVTSMYALTKRAGLRIADIQFFPDIHEGTIRFTLDRGQAPSQKLREYLYLELLTGFSELQTYIDFAEVVKANIKELQRTLCALKNSGCRVVAYGASAKLSTLLGAFQVPVKAALDYIVDDNPLKVGRHQTDTEIPILPVSSLKAEHAGLAILITPNNFSKEIRKRLTDLQLTGRIQVIEYVPTVTVEELS